MKFDLVTTSATKNFIKKLKDRPLKEKFKDAFEEIQLDPFNAGEAKKGDLAGVYGYDIYHNRTNYEIAYSIEHDDEGNFILIIMAGTREQFYQELKRYIKALKVKKKK